MYALIPFTGFKKFCREEDAMCGDVFLEASWCR
jgi:hypothetical protein